MCAANPTTVVKNAGRTGGTGGSNVGWREDRQQGITIRVTAHPGGGQLDDSDRGDTVIMSL